MDEKDKIIMSYLRRNARISLSMLSRKSRIPVSTIHDRIKSLAVNQRFTAIVRWSDLGYFAWAYILLKIGKGKKEELREYLMKKEEVNSLFKINNGYDFLLDVICVDLKRMEEFLEDIESKFPIKSKEIHYIIDDLKREAFLTGELANFAN